MTDELAPLRRRIDACDEQIVQLINERLKVALEVGELKTREGLPIRIPEREDEIIAKILKLNKGPCPSDVLKKVYRILIDTAVGLEESLDSSRPKK